MLLFFGLLGLFVFVLALVLRHDNFALLDVDLGYDEVAVDISLALLPRLGWNDRLGLRRIGLLLSLIAIRGF